MPRWRVIQNGSDRCGPGIAAGPGHIRRNRAELRDCRGRNRCTGRRARGGPRRGRGLQRGQGQGQCRGGEGDGAGVHEDFAAQPNPSPCIHTTGTSSAAVRLRGVWPCLQSAVSTRDIGSDQRWEMSVVDRDIPQSAGGNGTPMARRRGHGALRASDPELGKSCEDGESPVSPPGLMAC